MQRNLQTHQINPMAFSGRCYLGLSGVGLAAKWLRGLDLNQRPLGYEPNELPGCSTPQYQCSNTRHDGSTLPRSFDSATVYPTRIPIRYTRGNPG